MKYRSTRSDEAQASFSDILLAGLAPDGGLYLPVNYPQIDALTLGKWRKLLREQGYGALAFEVASLFVDDIPADDLRAICNRAYSTPAFSDPGIVSATQLGSGQIWIGHISNGPTAAFKDMAMQLLGELFEYELKRRGTYLNILGATSGDTGSSAEYALRGRSNIRVFMLTPAGRMTPFQQAQMFNISDPNIVNIAVDGVFDDCQDLVKAVNADAQFKAQHHIGAVNSINWARLMAQIVYYFALYLLVSTSDDEPVSFAVPTGNFGDICAGHIARQMGLPINRLIVATNENDVLDDFFHTGIYRPRGAKEVLSTSSPSMDIAKASNLERFIFDLLGANPAKIKQLFADQLVNQGFFDISDTFEFAGIEDDFGFVSGNSSHQMRLMTIQGINKNLGFMIDPHTADGVHVATDQLGKIDGKIISLETALPVKFADTIFEATGQLPDIPERFKDIENGSRKVIELANDLEAVKTLIETKS